MHIIPMAKDGELIIAVLGGDADLPLSGSVNISNYEIRQHNSNLLLRERVRYFGSLS